MSKEQSAKQKKLQQIFLDLRTNDEKKALKAVKSLETHGDATAIKPLAKCLLNDPSEKVAKHILELLSSLKDTSSKVELMEVIEDDNYQKIRQILLTTIWNMKIDFSDYLAEFVEIAVSGDFMESLECLTIIENMEGPFIEEDVLDAQLHLKDYLEANPGGGDAQKAHLLSEIALKIKEINRSLTD